MSSSGKIILKSFLPFAITLGAREYRSIAFKMKDESYDFPL
jgi:hypothetical protein